MKKLRYGLGLLGLIVGLNSTTLAQVNCADQYNQINSNFSAAYAALDAECYPSVNIPGTAISCIFTLTPECLAQYDDLGQQASNVWAQFYLDCPDYTPVWEGSGGLANSSSDSKKKTKGQLKNENKNMKIKIESLKQKLKAERKNRKLLEQSCTQ